MKRYLVTGLLIWVPLVITVWVLKLLIGTMDQSLLLLPEHLRPEVVLGFYIPGLGMLLALVVVLVTGMIGKNYFGSRLVLVWEGILARIPVVKSIYYSVKQISDTLLSSDGEAFRKVLLVRYPHPEAWSLAFQTNLPVRDIGSHLDEEHVAVFIPTTPSPVNGFYFFVKKSETIELDLSVDNALKYIISMGVVTPSNKPHPAKAVAIDR
ncbi:MAG: DUF502 domain-containing protein [Sulfuricellaceae bacterium]|nr:DUF502 domain-containing protein [Sulfuricellaceae bacterium]